MTKGLSTFLRLGLLLLLLVFTIKIMNEFIDVGAEIARPRRSQQDIFIQRLRKRVDPIFHNYKQEMNSSSHHVSLDPFKKHRSSRLKTYQYEE